MRKVFLFAIFILCVGLSVRYGFTVMAPRVARVDQALFEKMQDQLTQEAIRLRHELQESHSKESSLQSELAAKDSELAHVKGEAKNLNDKIEQLAQVESNEVSQGQSTKLPAGRELALVKKELAKRTQEIETLQKTVAVTTGTKQELSDQLAKTVQALQKEQADARERGQRIGLLTTQLKGLTDTRDACQVDLTTERTKITRTATLEQDLLDAKNELMLCKTELTSLSSDAAGRVEAASLRQRNQAATAKPAVASIVPAPASAALTNVAVTAPVVAAPVVQPASPMIIEVISEKANLRNGPGSEQGILMDVPKGVKLTVEEKRGKWYRVLAPTGERAFIDENVVKVVSAMPAPAAAVTAAAAMPQAVPMRAQLRQPNQGERSKKSATPVTISSDGDLESFGDVDNSGGPEAPSAVVRPVDADAAAFTNIKKAMNRR